LGSSVSDHNRFLGGIKSRPNSGNACYHLIRNLLSSRLLSKNIKIRIYKTIILPVVLYGCKTLSLISREEHGLRVFENRELRRIFEPTEVKLQKAEKKLHHEELDYFYSSPSIIIMIRSMRMSWAEYVARMGRRRMYIRY
jgi:hypothetical protein